MVLKLHKFPEQLLLTADCDKIIQIWENRSRRTFSAGKSNNENPLFYNRFCVNSALVTEGRICFPFSQGK